MEKLLIKPTNKADLELIVKVLTRMRIRFSVSEPTDKSKKKGGNKPNTNAQPI
jgi:hypothetical protein